ncbi:hypothetical protein DFS34DRAFT_671769 [Phlyctochytrium arcticum]|nr:hypothetical protein DFS34DRAFT_671769 [Phlyctochytrium arcticum]
MTSTRPPSRKIEISADSGDLELVTKEQRKVSIDDVSAWMQAWRAYQITNALLYPGRFKELQQHADHVIHLAGLYKWWVVYNYEKRHRIYAADHPDYPAPLDHTVNINSVRMNNADRVTTSKFKPAAAGPRVPTNIDACHASPPTTGKAAAPRTPDAGRAHHPQAPSLAPQLSGLPDLEAAPSRAAYGALLRIPGQADVIPRAQRLMWGAVTRRPMATRVRVLTSKPTPEPALTRQEIAATSHLLQENLYKIPTPVNVPALRKLLVGFPNTAYANGVLRNFLLRFPTQYEGPRIHKTPPNHQSANEQG